MIWYIKIRFVQSEIKMKGILKLVWLDTNNQIRYLVLTHVIALHVGGRYDSKYVFEKDSSTKSGSIQINKNTGLSKSKSTFNRKSITNSTKLLYVPDIDFILYYHMVSIFNIYLSFEKDGIERF